MSQLERVYKLDRLLRRKEAPSKREILQYFEISPAQFKRDLDFMRDRLGAPITFDAESGGYRYSSEEFNLPGLWFSEPEVYSILLMHALLDQLQPGLVREQLNVIFRAHSRQKMLAPNGVWLLKGRLSSSRLRVATIFDLPSFVKGRRRMGALSLVSAYGRHVGHS
jgi:predicted DNA-binding transcriptional regulator YafY